MEREKPGDDIPGRNQHPDEGHGPSANEDKSFDHLSRILSEGQTQPNGTDVVIGPELLAEYAKLEKRKLRQREAQRRWRQNHPEKHRAEVARWQVRHRVERAQYLREWRRGKKPPAGQDDRFG